MACRVVPIREYFCFVFVVPAPRGCGLSGRGSTFTVLDPGTDGREYSSNLRSRVTRISGSGPAHAREYPVGDQDSLSEWNDSNECRYNVTVIP